MTKLVVTLAIAALCVSACDNNGAPSAGAAPKASARAPATVPLDPTNIVRIASDSKDHTTLVAALKAADYVSAAAASGPLTVFAPTNAAFEKLPKETLDSLMKPENQQQLKTILQYHVTTSVHKTEDMKEGDEISMANGAKATIHVKDGKFMINDATITASIPASNGIIHVVDTVLQPPK